MNNQKLDAYCSGAAQEGQYMGAYYFSVKSEFTSRDQRDYETL